MAHVGLALDDKLLRSTKKFSFASFFLSPLTTTVIVVVVWPGAKVSVPELATASSSLVLAVPFAVANFHPHIVGGRQRDREGEKRRLSVLALGLAEIADADARLVVVLCPRYSCS